MPEILPLIITAPHCVSTLPKKFRDRCALTDFELWQMSDPFTDETCQHPKAFAIHKAFNHRCLGDLNRDRDHDRIFPDTDFYGREIWKTGQKLTHEEKEHLLRTYWDPYRQAIWKSIEKLEKTGHQKIFLIDHHNTAIDHPANHGQYLPPFVLGNYGNENGERHTEKISASAEILQSFQKSLVNEFPGITVEMNKVYRGSSVVRYIRDEIQPCFANLQIQAFLLEYNLNFIYNPISGFIDKKVKERLKNGLNQAINSMIVANLNQQ